MTIKSHSEFRGVFAERIQVGDDPFASDLYLSLCKEQAQLMAIRSDKNPFADTLLRRMKHLLKPKRWPSAAKSIAARKIPDFETQPYLLPLVDAIRATVKNKGSCRVLDIGGGWGDNYLLIGRALLSLRKRLEYTVVDNERLTDLGAKLYASCKSKPKFANSIPNEKFDFVVICGTLQYVDDWQAFLQTCKAISQSIYLTRSAITDGDGFFTQQTVFIDGANAGTYPYRVFGREEMRSAMKDWHTVLESATDDYSPPFAEMKIKARLFAHLWRHQVAV